jgi:UDP-glucose 4-epimerase
MGIDNLATGREENFPHCDEAILVRGDICNRGALRNVFMASRPEVVFHCAASYKDPNAWERDIDTNIHGTLEVLRACAEFGVRRIVYFQTSLCYGLDPLSPVKPDAPLDPRSSYAISKTAAEQFISLSGIDYVSLRLANVYGPRNLSGPVPAFYKRLAAGQTPTVVDTRRDFVFVDDLVDLAVRFTFPESLGGVWHVAHGWDYSIMDLYQAVAATMQIDDQPAPALQPRGLDDAGAILLDPSETALAFAWSASTPLADGIAAAVEWYRANGVADTYTHLRMKG